MSTVRTYCKERIATSRKNGFLIVDTAGQHVAIAQLAGGYAGSEIGKRRKVVAVTHERTSPSPILCVSEAVAKGERVFANDPTYCHRGGSGSERIQRGLSFSLSSNQQE